MADIQSIADRVIDTDVLVIGSEGAGARAAIAAFDSRSDLNVAVATKGYLGRTGATVTAASDFSIDSRSAADIFGLPGNREDSVEKFLEDMLKAGRYLNDQRLAEIHVQEAPRALKDLVDWGIKAGELKMHPGHTFPRGVMITGTEYPRVLGKEIRKRKIQLFEHLMITDLLVSGNRVQGAVGLHIVRGEFWFIRTKAVILCTGGGMRIYPYTTAPEDLTGDGLAMAYRAGAELVNMEFPQFLPYCLIHPPAMRGNNFLYGLAISMEAYALNRKGERYMKKWDPQKMEFSTRDLNSVAAMVEVMEGRGSEHGGTYLSFKHLPDNLIEYSSQWLPPHAAHWRHGGFNMKEFLPDLGREAVEIAPAAHFFNGGIKINERCETNVVGLFAAGEGAGSLHGADRLSGNALTQTQVWGKRAGKFAAEFAVGAPPPAPDPEELGRLRERLFRPLQPNRDERPVAIKRDIQQVAWTQVGMVKSRPGLEKALQAIERMKQQIDQTGAGHKGRVYNRDWCEALQIENMLLVLEAIAHASLLREESRGCHYRSDHTYTDNREWLKTIDIKQANGEMRLTAKDLQGNQRPPMDRVEYNAAHLKA